MTLTCALQRSHKDYGLYDQAPVDAGYSQPGSKRLLCKVGRMKIALPLSSLNAIVRDKRICGRDTGTTWCPQTQAPNHLDLAKSRFWNMAKVLEVNTAWNLQPRGMAQRVPLGFIRECLTDLWLWQNAGRRDCLLSIQMVYHLGGGEYKEV